MRQSSDMHCRLPSLRQIHVLPCLSRRIFGLSAHRTVEQKAATRHPRGRMGSSGDYLPAKAGGKMREWCG